MHVYALPTINSMVTVTTPKMIRAVNILHACKLKTTRTQCSCWVLQPRTTRTQCNCWVLQRRTMRKHCSCWVLQLRTTRTQCSCWVLQLRTTRTQCSCWVLQLRTPRTQCSCWVLQVIKCHVQVLTDFMCLVVNLLLRALNWSLKRIRNKVTPCATNYTQGSIH